MGYIIDVGIHTKTGWRKLKKKVNIKECEDGETRDYADFNKKIERTAKILEIERRKLGDVA